MKKVFGSNKELAHVWAQQKQSEGRGNSMFFNNKIIYSFGYHYAIAKFHGDIVLVNSKGYSSCTGKHTNDVWRAITHKKSFYVPNVLDAKSEENIIHLSNNVADSLKACFSDRVFQSSWRSNTALEDLKTVIKLFNDYCTTFKIKQKLLELDSDTLSLINEFIKAQALKQTKYKAEEPARTAKNTLERNLRLGKAAAEVIAKHDLLVKQWLDGENVSFPYSRGIKLRIKGEEVQTSHGAIVPLAAARSLVELVKTKQIKGGETVGEYTVTELNEQNLIVGCHTIPLTEISRVFGLGA